MEPAQLPAQLMLRLTQQPGATEVFSAFAAAAHEAFPGLRHISIFLLPGPSEATGGDAPAAAKPAPPPAAAGKAAGKAPRAAAGKPAAAAAAAKQQQPPPPPPPAAPAPPAAPCGGACAGGRASLEWGRCCVFHLLPGRGHVVQAVPSWPAACTAAAHAAAEARLVVTDDYARGGPHFADWAALAAAGARSMAAAPLVACGRPAAVLCLASSEPGAFSDRSAVELTAAALAPYTSHLQHTTRRAEMQRLVSDLITPIASQLAQQKSSQQGGGGGADGGGGEEGPPGGAPEGARRRGRGGGGAGDGGGQAAGAVSHKRFESVIVKSQPGPAGDPLGPDPDLEWGDFLFNLVSMCIVYAYFSRAAVAGESVAAILLCMGVAAFDVLLLVMRWLAFEQYVAYGGLVLAVFQAYRAVVLPIANTWMSWSLLNKMDLVSPGYPLPALLGAALVACLVAGLQVRFFLHAPLQLASVLFAATSAPAVCGPSAQPTTSISCMLSVSGLQLGLGLGVPTVMLWLLEGRGGRTYMPHMQCKRVALHP